MNYTRFSLRSLLSVYFGLMIATFSAETLAMGVTPLDVEMVCSGTHSRSSFTVRNPGIQPLPFHVTVFELELGENGERQRTPVTGLFAIFPPSAMISPGGTQIVRMQWIGDPNLAKSRHFLFTVSQVPVKTAEKEHGMKVFHKGSIAVSVAPAVGSFDLAVKKVEIVDVGGKRRPVITVRNTGVKHARLSEIPIVLSGAGWSYRLDFALLKPSIGVGLVPAGKSRRLPLPADVPPNVTSIEARLEYATR